MGWKKVLGVKQTGGLRRNNVGNPIAVSTFHHPALNMWKSQTCSNHSHAACPNPHRIHNMEPPLGVGFGFRVEPPRNPLVLEGGQIDEKRILHCHNCFLPGSITNLWFFADDNVQDLFFSCIEAKSVQVNS